MSASVTPPKPPYVYVGGKRRMLAFILENTPPEFGDFHEPFLGGGAVALAMMEANEDARFYLSDLDEQIPLTWDVIRGQLDELIELLDEHSLRHSREYYASVAAWDVRGLRQVKSDAEWAARFIYLCGGGFGGGYKTRADGTCSNSFGRDEFNFSKANLRRVSSLLRDRNVHLSAGSYAEILPRVKAGDFVYLDPPYATDSDDGSQTWDLYSNDVPSIKMQKQVKSFISKLGARGAYALASNASTETTRNLFDGWNLISKQVMWTGGAAKRSNTEMLWGNANLVRALHL